MADDADFMAKAVALACENARLGRGGPFGAIVVHEGNVVGEGSNQVTGTNDPTAHAEVVALRTAAKKLDRFVLQGCVLYTSCEPCPMCLAAAYWARVDRIVFAATQDDAAAAGFDDVFLYEEIGKPHHARQLPIKRLAIDAEDPFKVWLANPNRIPY
jgi:tRNA(Arg) A34 adenosine deaminase TadA